MSVIAFVLLLAAVLGGGTAAAAQDAQPNNPLYAFKINLNEKVELALARSPQERATVDIALAGERLSEAQKLGKALTPQEEMGLAANFSSNVRDAHTQTATLQTAGQYQAAADIAASMQSMLADESSILGSAAQINGITALVPLVNTARAELDSASSLNTSASAEAAINASNK